MSERDDVKDTPECTLANDFSTWEKTYALLSFTAIFTIGTVGIALLDWRWALVYVVIYLYGIFGVVMRHLVCPRCPHLHVYDDCLQFPTGITKRIVKGQKTTPFSPLEKWLFCGYFIVIPLFPIYWLLTNPILLVAFVVAVGMWYLAQFLRFCRRCRVSQCPFNRVPSLVSRSGRRPTSVCSGRRRQTASGPWPYCEACSLVMASDVLQSFVRMTPALRWDAAETHSG
jgi:hypothetical protein